MCKNVQSCKKLVIMENSLYAILGLYEKQCMYPSNRNTIFEDKVPRSANVTAVNNNIRRLHATERLLFPDVRLCEAEM